MLDLPVPIVTDMEQVADHERIIQVDLYVDEAHEAPLMQQMPGCFSNRWSPLFTDVNRTGNSKHRGIDIIAAHYGIDLRDTIAFGDGGNDISMLRHAGLGIAMGNARRSRETECRIHHRRCRQRRRNKSPAPLRTAVTARPASSHAATGIRVTTRNVFQKTSGHYIRNIKPGILSDK